MGRGYGFNHIKCLDAQKGHLKCCLKHELKEGMGSLWFTSIHSSPHL